METPAYLGGLLGEIDANLDSAVVVEHLEHGLGADDTDGDVVVLGRDDVVDHRLECNRVHRRGGNTRQK